MPPYAYYPPQKLVKLQNEINLIPRPSKDVDPDQLAKAKEHYGDSFSWCLIDIGMASKKLEKDDKKTSKEWLHEWEIWRQARTRSLLTKSKKDQEKVDQAWAKIKPIEEKLDHLKKVSQEFRKVANGPTFKKLGKQKL